MEKQLRPKVQLTGENGNILNLASIAGLALKDAGLRDEAAAMINEVMDAGSYDEALQIIMRYVDAS